MNPRVNSAVPHSDYTLTLVFVGGETRLFDVTPYLHYPVFQPLRDPGFFALATVRHGTVSWPRSIDFDPDTLYLESSEIR